MTKARTRKSRDTYHHGDLRAQLIKATRELVESVGPDRFSVSEACRAAGVSTAAPYKHFSDKQDMLNAVSMDAMHRQQQAMHDALQPHQPGTLDRIVALGQNYVGFAQQEPGVFRLVFGLTEGHASKPKLIEQGASTLGIVEKEVALFRGSKRVSKEDKQRAFLLWSFVHGLAFLQIDGKLTDMSIHIDQDKVLWDVARRVMVD